MGHLAGQHEVGVDPGAAILQGGCTGHRLADILGPDGGGEAILGVVGKGDGLLEIIDRGDGDHGAKHLLLHDLILLACTGDHSRFEEVAGACPQLAAGDYLQV